MHSAVPASRAELALSDKRSSALEFSTRTGLSRARHLDVVRAGAVERVEAVDGLRGLMAWAVAVYHLGLLSGAARGSGVAASAAAVLGLHSVEAFFLISGFCFFYVQREARFDPARYCRFQLQRFLRLAPLFYLVLALNLVFGLPAGPAPSALHLLENLTLGFGLTHPNHAMVVGGWSIGIEFVFYLVFPLAVGLARSRVLPLVAAGGLSWLAWDYSAGHVATAADSARFNAYVLLPNHAFAFALGAVIAGLRARTRFRVSPQLALAALGGGIGIWISTRPAVVDHFAIVLGAERAKYVAASFAAVLGFALSSGGPPALRRVLSGIGELSYAVYLLHPLAWELTRAWLPAQLHPALALAAALATTLGLSLAACHAVERPMARFRAQLRRAERRRPAGVPEAAARPIAAEPM